MRRATVIDLKAHRQARARKRLSQKLPRVWVKELRRSLVVLGTFTGSNPPGAA